MNETSERVREHFEDAAGRFDSLYTREHGESGIQRRLRPGLYLRAQAAVDLVRELPARSVLDVGCGSGRVGEQALDAGARSYVGVDFSQPMLELAEQRLGRFGDSARLVQGDFLEAELGGPFDVVLALGFFDYLDEPHRFARRMYELCSGAVLASFPCWTWVKGPVRKVRYEWINDCPIFNYTERELRLMFGACGFGRVEIDRVVRSGYLVRAYR